MNYNSLIYLWDRRSLFIGRLDEPLKMCQGAACLVLSLGEPLFYRSSEDESYRPARSVLTRAGEDYEIDTRGELVVNCMLDPFGEDYAMLLTQMGEDVAANGARFDSRQEEHYRAAFRDIYQNGMPYEQTYELLDRVLREGVDENLPPHPVDARIVAVVDELKQRVHENLSIDDLAAVANLSVSRLVQLFKQQTGIPIRRYRCWHRLFVASVLVAKTGNLTEASVAAGFTDASHFTKTFHAMVGMSPSKLLSRPQRVRLIIE
ncbi:MAG: helix-turn-helix domain-containing protein [Oleiphilaceae bacterium]|nr:helix-turn-helix domain-containing protein [Oleiphilaceae bacterium]